MPNSSGTFLSASEDPTGTLAEVEKKIARATMIPRKHGEVLAFALACNIFVSIVPARRPIPTDSKE